MSLPATVARSLRTAGAGSETLASMGGSALAVPLSGKVLFSMAAIGFFLVWLLAMRKAFRHECYLLPFIGEIARAHVEQLGDERP